MADKKMLSNGNGPKKGIIEQTYQKKSQLEHILLRPDTYIRSVEKVTEKMWTFNMEKEMMEQREIEYVPGLYKIFDEILVNAADNKQRDKKMDCIRIEIRPEENKISVWNNGKGIPVVMHKEEKMFVPTMIFGHLLTSSNYNDEEEKVTGGRNGYGAKLCNIFSDKFIVETASKQYKKQFKQIWTENMSKASEPQIKDFHGEEFTKITFHPDLKKFKMDQLNEGIVALMSRRAYDVAASTRGVKVFLNDQKLPVKNFKDYIDLFIKDKEDERGNSLKVIYEQPNERWEVAVTMSDGSFQQVSFVNSIATTKGGRHVDHVVDLIVEQLQEVFKKKNKGGMAIKSHQIKSHMWVFVNCLIVNPTFDSQTKENMTLQAKSFGSKCYVSEKFINSVQKSGIVETVLTWAQFKQQNVLAKATAGKRMKKLKGIPKLEDANEAGANNGLKCTLILTYGDSAKSLAVSGLGEIGRDYYGVFPLRGILLNVREATHKQLLENAEINNLIKILGLQYKKKYLNVDDMKTLRYGKVMIMTDQDQDGSHIKSLIINFVHHNWPELLQRDFLEEFITPIVKARKKNQELSFYSLPEFDEWKRDTPNHHTFEIKYYKGLGTSTSKEAKEYFRDMSRHRIRFDYKGQEDDDHIVLAFSRKHIEERKEWLTNFMVESKRRKENGLAERYLYTKDTRSISYKDFVNLELVIFSNADNIRSIPCLVDGFKPGQRKVIYTCIKRNDKREVKVAQLAGSVAEQAGYQSHHHGDVSLCATIVNLAQNYVGSNNINLLEPRGQFGTRLMGGKDSANPRNIFTKMSPMTRMIFHPHDDGLLKHKYDDNQKIEPEWYIPIIPMILVNGADGIGTGWMTKIPNYNPRDLVECIRAKLNNEEPKELHPWYKNFKGTIEYAGEKRYCISGEISILSGRKFEITELPVSCWTQPYKENTLEPMLGTDKVKATLQDYREYNTDTTVRFVLTPLENEFAALKKDGLHKNFKLQSLVSISSMCCFDELGCLRRFDSVMDILDEFYKLRLKMYKKRKDYLEGMLQAEADRLTNQVKFIMEKCSGTIMVENKKLKTSVDGLVKRGYVSDPVQEWKRRNLQAEEEAQDTVVEEDEEAAAQQTQNKSSSNKTPEDSEKAFKSLSDVKKFDYLLGMSMWMLTDEKKNELLRQRDNKLAELHILQKKSPPDLWREDLDAFLKKLDEVEEKERKDEAAVVGKAEKKQVGEKETMPSPMSQRVIPEVSDEVKKKIQKAVKTKKSKEKRGNKKENVEKKKATKKRAGNAVVKGDGLKQTKLNFEKKGKKVKKDDDDYDLSSDNSDVDFEAEISTSPVKERRPRRAAAKVAQYRISDDDSSDGEPELYVNDSVREKSAASSQAAAAEKSSEDLFDSLINSDPEAAAASTSGRNKIPFSSTSDSEDTHSGKSSQKAVSEKSEKPQPKKLKKTIIPKKTTKKSAKKLTSDNSDDESYEDEDMPNVTRRRGKAKTTFVISDTD